ncbi:hypothetical protein [Ideonella livida]|uniref:hypothetical protein n=1 Tax=Ideonella livida TaxID=2707176 RepID=UPI001940360E|nr:hypothetical protein [Ideonella livida]
MEPLRFLEFDCSEDTEGRQTWDAVASVTPRHWPALQGEVAGLLAWLHRCYGDRQGPAEDGGLWDFDLHGLVERSAPQEIRFDGARGELRLAAAGSETVRHTLTLSLSLDPAVADRLAEALGLEIEGD